MSRRNFLVFSSTLLSSNLFAYKNMKKQSKRADDLNMRTKDYTMSMAFAGILVGFEFVLFLWKIR